METEAVIFDMGGVIVTGPFSGFARYEREAGLPDGFIRLVNSTDPDTNAWSQFERGVIDRREFARRFEAEALALGGRVNAERVLASMAGQPVPAMIELIRELSNRYLVGMITNNLAPTDWSVSSLAPIIGCFGAVVESSIEGVRKPDTAIYELACARLGVAAPRCVFLDDLGINLKPARALGMHTIKVVDPDAAADELRRMLL